MTITYSRLSFFNIFYNWESSRGPQENLLWTVCCAGLLQNEHEGLKWITMSVLILWRWELVIVTYTWASKGGKVHLDFKIFNKNGCFLVSSGKNQISPLLAPTGKKTFQRPCAYNVWNKTPEYIFQSEVLNKYVIRVWSNNLTAAFFISFIMTGFISDRGNSK